MLQAQRKVVATSSDFRSPSGSFHFGPRVRQGKPHGSEAWAGWRVTPRQRAPAAPSTLEGNHGDLLPPLSRHQPPRGAPYRAAAAADDAVASSRCRAWTKWSIGIGATAWLLHSRPDCSTGEVSRRPAWIWWRNRRGFGEELRRERHGRSIWASQHWRESGKRRWTICGDLEERSAARRVSAVLRRPLPVR